jgi:hypothetical protein
MEEWERKAGELEDDDFPAIRLQPHTSCIPGAGGRRIKQLELRMISEWLRALLVSYLADRSNVLPERRQFMRERDRKRKTVITCCRSALLPFWLELLDDPDHIRKISKAFKLSFPSSATIYNHVNNHHMLLCVASMFQSLYKLMVGNTVSFPTTPCCDDTHTTAN